MNQELFNIIVHSTQNKTIEQVNDYLDFMIQEKSLEKFQFYWNTIFRCVIWLSFSDCTNYSYMKRMLRMFYHGLRFHELELTNIILVELHRFIYYRVELIRTYVNLQEEINNIKLFLYYLLKMNIRDDSLLLKRTFQNLKLFFKLTSTWNEQFIPLFFKDFNTK